MNTQHTGSLKNGFLGELFDAVVAVSLHQPSQRRQGGFVAVDLQRCVELLWEEARRRELMT